MSEYSPTNGVDVYHLMSLNRFVMRVTTHYGAASQFAGKKCVTHHWPFACRYVISELMACWHLACCHAVESTAP